MAWPKGYTKAQVAALNPEEKRALFSGKGVPKAVTPPPATVQNAPQAAAPKEALKRVQLDEIPPNLFDGQHKSLEVMGRDGNFDDPIPGYYCYWFIDRDSGQRISQALRSGYQFVDNTEVVLNHDIVSGNDDLGGHVRKFSKEVIDGKPVYMYLMKKPRDLKAKHDAQMHAIDDRNEYQINHGRVSSNPQDRQYRPGDYAQSNMPKIERTDKLYR